jgi:predicted anti-sigma-YlaC factor YlaD
MLHWMFRCKDVSKKVSISMDRPLPLPERMMITAHLWMCKYCRRFRDQMLILRNALRLADLPGDDQDQRLTLPGEIKERIKQSMRKIFSDPIK